jgi:cytochrome c-type biogenesis protein
MEQLLTTLSHGVEGSAWIAPAAAFAWGVLSILLSPCHLTSIPLIVGFIGGQERMTARRAFVTALLFAVGIMATIVVIGVMTAAAGRLLGDVGRWGNYVVAAIFFAVGLCLLDVLRLPLPGAPRPLARRQGLLAALALGMVFGVALGPCTFAYMAPMLALVFKLAAANMAYGVLLLLCYGAGHCGVIVLAGAFAGATRRYLDWNEKSRGTTLLKRVCGALALLGGLYLLYIAR